MRRPPYQYGLIGAFILQAGLLAYIVYDQASLLLRGTEIRLSVVPIDPRDLLRGDYVVLSYDISRLHSGKLKADRAFSVGDTLYVSLQQDGEDWKPISLSGDIPAQMPFLRGLVTSVQRAAMTGDEDCTATGGQCFSYAVEYNLEKFFVPEGAGREIEDMRNSQRVSVDVAVASDGRSALKRLLIDSKVVYDQPALW